MQFQYERYVASSNKLPIRALKAGESKKAKAIICGGGVHNQERGGWFMTRILYRKNEVRT